MKRRAGALTAGIVLVFLSAVAVDAGALTVLGPPTAIQLGALDRLTELVRGLDRFLEAVLDLLRTLTRLFGEGGD
ncbi:hypothetical protein [Halogeometricum luteum]|uniref:Secreted protein n=1 Tax=Halogeometricum luteum TaxID=2950537 RepID=A0ABU2FZQ9_9EURY|nr:hypothetical protein [Halogeometricum sp. S3BR5-2]MDS0294031.1 hypothetical protein [Halogeometricum sp. S3BR5-2]